MNEIQKMDNLFNEYVASIKVIGVGGAGNNAINRMVEEEIEGVEFIATNTDAQALLHSKVKNRFTLGFEITKGLGAGANPDVGRQAAEASETIIRDALRGADMVFIAAGMGGGTGTGAAPVIARIAKELGALTIGIVTRPFTFEGKVRNAHAVEGLQALRPNVDTLIVVSNDQLLQMNGTIPLRDSFREADNILCHSVKTITDLIIRPALINLDFADIRNIMADRGTALIGMGIGEGENRARQAASQAVTSPLLEASIAGARNAIVNVTGGVGMRLIDANEAVEIIREAAGDSDINIIFGVAIDENLEDKMSVTVIATDFIGADYHRVDRSPTGTSNRPNNDIVRDALPKIDPLSLKPFQKEMDKPKVKVEAAPIVEPLVEDDSLLPSFLRRKKKG
jgi:cell division protein FtsZ